MHILSILTLIGWAAISFQLLYMGMGTDELRSPWKQRILFAVSAISIACLAAVIVTQRSIVLLP